MFDNSRFQTLVEAGNLTGEVVAINRFIVEVKGLEGVRLGSQVLFEDGQPFAFAVALPGIADHAHDPGDQGQLHHRDPRPRERAAEPARAAPRQADDAGAGRRSHRHRQFLSQRDPGRAGKQVVFPFSWHEPDTHTE